MAKNNKAKDKGTGSGLRTVGGVAAGAAAGALLGPVGAAVGAVVGGLAGARTGRAVPGRGPYATVGQHRQTRSAAGTRLPGASRPFAPHLTAGVRDVPCRQLGRSGSYRSRNRLVPGRVHGLHARDRGRVDL